MTHEELKLFTHEELQALRHSGLSSDKFVLLRKNPEKEIALSPELKSKLRKLADKTVSEYHGNYPPSPSLGNKVCVLSQLSTLLLNALKIGKEVAPYVEEIVDHLIGFLK